MKKALILILFISFSCKSSKTIESKKTNQSLDLKTEIKSEISEIKRRGGITEIISEVTTSRSIPSKNDSGEEIIIQEQRTEKKTERLILNEETEKTESKNKSEQEVKQESNQTDIEEEKEGFLRLEFGTTGKKIVSVILLALFVWFVFFIRKRQF